jgi:hypothetical protein
MQALIKTHEFDLNSEDLEMINERINLSLSRFNTIISKCELIITNEYDKHSPQTAMVCCSIQIVLQNGTKINCNELGKHLDESFLASLSRIKRGIERHLKRGKTNRISNMQQIRAN